MVLTRACTALLLVLLVAAPARADREVTREALARLEETLRMRREDRSSALTELTPALIVSTRPMFEETRTWFPAAARAALVAVLGSSGLRVCEACAAPRTFVADGSLVQNTGDVSLEELLRLDEGTRGTSAPARTAVWLDETEAGVALRIVELANARVVLAENFEPYLEERARTRRNFSLTRDLERRSRGDALTHVFIDAALYPSQHVSVEWAEQWGPDNGNLAGFVLSAFDPVLGLGAAYHRVIPQALNITVGAKAVLSVPTAVIDLLATQGAAPTQLIDPLMSVVFVVRVPIPQTNFGLTVTGSTNGRFGAGISLMNFSLLPILP